jgi:membrane-bound ClpP family serine protease
VSALAANPDALLLLLLAGVGLIDLECNRPGWVVPGCAGCVLVLFSLHRLAALPLAPAALAGICVALLLVTCGIFWRRRVLPAACGGLLLALSLAHLLQPNGAARVHPVTATLVSGCFTSSTVWLGRIALRARHNKRARRNELGAASNRGAAPSLTG